MREGVCVVGIGHLEREAQVVAVMSATDSHDRTTGTQHNTSKRMINE